LGEGFPAQLAELRAGSVLAGYMLEAQVGAGGMAVVFRARDERLGRLVALKILAPALADDPGFRRRFIAESRAAAAVDDPHIIPIYEAGEAQDVLFIAMRFVAGGDLRGTLDREGALPPDRAAGFLSPVALDAAHGAGLVHRDVKPANILVDTRRDRTDHVYLSDFGVSKGAISSVSLTGEGHFLGTPDYSAPEQIQGLAVDGRADQYALACVAFQLLTGVVPFERDKAMSVLFAHLSEPPPSLGSRRRGVPAAADAVLVRGMAKVPEKRFRSCAAFADALREALGLAPYRSLEPLHVTVRPLPPATKPSSITMPPGSAAASTVDQVPDGPKVVMPTDPGRARSRSRPSGSVWKRWLVPVAAAAVIVAIVAAVLAIVGSPKPKAHVTESAYSLGRSVPPYYVWITPGNPGDIPSEAMVRMTATGAVLGTVKAAAPGGTIVAVTGADDDRTFVLDEQPFQTGAINSSPAWYPRTFYVLRLKADGRPAAVTKLPISGPVGAEVTGLALSPDGTKLAMAIMPNISEPNMTELKLFSVPAGKVLRTWHATGSIGFNADDPEALSWTSDQQALAFLWAATGKSPRQGEWLLDLGKGGTNLLNDSRQVMSLGDTSSGRSRSGLVCQQDVIITPDGSAVVCGAVILADLVQNPRIAKSAYLEYSPASGTVIRILAQWTLRNAGALALDVLWSNASGSVLIGQIPTTGNGEVGMIRAGMFTPLPKLGPPGINVIDQGAW
jgi:serine/threonine protein kinase